MMTKIINAKSQIGKTEKIEKIEMDLITLNGKQIRDLAVFAGFVVVPQADDDLDSEYTISECPPSGLTDDNVTFDHYRYVARCDECPEEGFVGIGDAVKT